MDQRATREARRARAIRLCHGHSGPDGVQARRVSRPGGTQRTEASWMESYQNVVGWPPWPGVSAWGTRKRHKTDLQAPDLGQSGRPLAGHWPANGHPLQRQKTISNNRLPLSGHHGHPFSENFLAAEW